MKLNILLIPFLFFLFLNLSSSLKRPLIKHETDEWMEGSISKKQNLFSPPITEKYEEMLKNREKKLISLGLNNSGIVNLNDTVVISDDMKYIGDDGVTGALSSRPPNEKNQITYHYEEMLADKNKKIISMNVNRTAFYDPDSQVVVKNTGEMPAIDPLDNYYANKLDRNYLETPELIKNNENKGTSHKKKTKRNLENFLSK